MNPCHENSRCDIVLGVGYLTGSIPRCPLCYHSPVHRNINFRFIGIKPQLKKEILELCVVCKIVFPGIEQRLSTVI